MKTSDLPRLVTAIFVSEFAGIVGSVFTIPAIPNWYAALDKPFLNPPSWIFGPVWTILYFLMGISVFLIWRKGLKRKEVKVAICIFILQLILNIVWSVFFFGFHDLGMAFIEIVVLWLAIFGTMSVFYKISMLATYLLIPYILWVTFAGYLNYAIWALN